MLFKDPKQPRKLIALCGAPRAGKTTAQAYLQLRYGVEMVDDAAPLREFAMSSLGLSRYHVAHPKGKETEVVLPGGRKLRVRDVLGRLGNAIEDIAGPDSIPEMAIHAATWSDPSGLKAYSFGSVRREQARVYKRYGAKVIEITRPGMEVVNEYDQYDRSLVDLTIANDSTVAVLNNRLEFHLGPWLSEGLHI